MTVWFDADGNNGGHVAIYTGNDDAPMDNPTAYIGSRTKFSTRFNYIPFVPARRIQTTVTVPGGIADVARGPMRRTINLGSHGMGGVPFIYGFATVSGVIRPLCGTVPIRVATSGSGNIIHWTLGVNATNVFISEGRSFPIGWGNFSVAVNIYISDKVI
jgi:hypothetical protein